MKKISSVAKKDEMSLYLRRRLNEFYEMRNRIVHSISYSSGIGTTIFSEWAEFFRVLTAAIATAFDESYRAFVAEIARAKANAT
jgi:hypothetical protein